MKLFFNRFWSVVLLLFLVAVQVPNHTCLQQNASANRSITLSAIQDVEMLTYFLLWKHDYFDHIEQSSEEELNRLDENKLRQFIDKLKIKNLMSAEINSTKRCDDETFEKLRNQPWWPVGQFEKTKAICEAASSCQSAKDLTRLIGMDQDHNPALSQSLARLCPLMLFQLQEKECSAARELNFKAKIKPTAGSVWGFAFLFVTIVSFCSLAGVGILPFLTDKSYETLLTVLQGLAVGSLCGSALFHLIPQAFNLVITSENHEYLWRALIIFGGIYLFFWSERLMKIVSEYRRKKKMVKNSVPSTTSFENENEKFRQVYFVNDKANNGEVSEEEAKEGMITTTNGSAGHDPSVLIVHDGLRERSTSAVRSIDHGHSHGGDGEIATIAWMIIFGDALHNFIDGIAIGAAFTQSIMEGISISVAVICEEFPHELGDFAILIGSGMSMRKALGYNFLSACTCYLGMVVGIFLGDLADAQPYIFAFAGGMFLYISLVDMMGELTSKLEQASKKRGLGFTVQMLLLQNVGLLFGVFIMFFLAKYNDKINFEGLVPPKNSDMPFTELS